MGFRGFRGLSVSSLASTSGAGAAGAAGASVLSIKVCINSWKMSFGGATGAGTGAGPGAGALIAGLPRRTGGIVESRERSGEQRVERRVTFLAF